MNTILQGQIKGADKELSNLSNRQKALHNIGGRPKRNLLDNWYFVGGGSQQGGGQFPINQRGELVYHGPAYGIDRWVIQQGVTLTVNADGITIQNTGSQEAQFFQILELTKFYPGASYTASALVKSVTGNASIFLQENGGDFSTVFNFALHDGLNYGSGIFNEADFENNLRLIFVIGAGASVKLSSSKLELGPTQTLAYQDEDGNWQLFETPDYAEELAKCQRFFENAPIYTGFTVGASGDILDIFVPFKQTKRIVPTVIISPRTTFNSGKAEAWNGNSWESFSVNMQCYINGFRVFGTAPHPDNHVQFIYTASAEP